MIDDLSEVEGRLDTVNQEMIALERMEKFFLQRHLKLMKYNKQVSPHPQIKPHVLSRWTMKITDTPPIGMRSKIGTIANELRSCLDEIAYRLAVRNNASESELHKVQFPIMKSEEVFRDTGLKQKIKMLSLDDRKKIEEITPWKGGNDTLFQLTEVDNMRKHRRLMVCVSKNSGFEFDGIVAIGKFAVTGGVAAVKPNKEYEFAFGEDVHGEIDFIVRVGFQEPEDVKGKQVIPLLSVMRDEVRSILNLFRQPQA